MSTIHTISRETYWDKVYACWIGKNCGGTLGAPLELIYGQEEPFAIDWYPELREGGIPNDDLEMQLIWLKAVEERGFHLTSRDLAQYWLDHIGYNWDEYGLNKTNLRLGLLPPVSGYFNNWFRDCMGSPIRSEIWACLAPGVPSLAARMAYEDAIVDHGGGEGVWGEIFNAALESAAFVESNPHILLECALSYLPSASATARAVRIARAAHASGVSWQEARQEVLRATPHYVAQYTPPNIGFQVIGWLYGQDFGDALCTAVNCGYDTDCTGATLGALLGILGGRAGLPTRWTAPLGEAIATNESWGGLFHASTGRNPIPTTLRELTDRVCTLGERLLAAHDAPVRIGDKDQSAPLSSLHASEQEASLFAEASPLALTYALQSLNVTLTYLHSPVLVPGIANAIEVQIHNDHPAALTITLSLPAPDDWHITPASAQQIVVPAQGQSLQHYTLQVENPAALANSNRLDLKVQAQGRPMECSIPLAFIGARRWLIWQAEPGVAEDLNDEEKRLEKTELLVANGTEESFSRDDGNETPGWRVLPAEGNALPEEVGADWVGTMRAQLSLWNPLERPVHIGIPATCPRKLWINGQLAHMIYERSRLRPGYQDDGVSSYVDTVLQQGWNTLSIAYTRGFSDPPFAGHVTLASDGLYAGLTDVVWTHFPWERHDGKNKEA